MNDFLKMDNVIGFNTMGLFTFSFFFGIVLAAREERDLIILDILSGFNDVLFVFVRLLSW